MCSGRRRAYPRYGGRRTSPVAGRAVGGGFAALQVANFRRYFAGQAVSVSGDHMQNVGLAWYVLQVSGSGVAVGVVAAARYLPVLAFGAWGGLVADRFDQRRVVVICQSSAGVVAVLLAVTVALPVRSLVPIYVMAACLGALNVVTIPARQGLINELVPPRVLNNAIALTSVMTNVARIAGPSIAAVLIAGAGITWCFAANAGTFVLAVASLLLLDRSALTPSTRARRAPAQVREGLRYALGDPRLAVPLALTAVLGMFTWEFPVTLPLLADHTFHGGAQTYGTMLATLGAGAVAGGLVVARHPAPTPPALGRAALFWGLTVLLAAAAPNLYLEFAALLLVGYGAVRVNAFTKTMLQLTAVPWMRGRVLALWFVAWQGTTPLGAPLLGWIGQSSGARWALATGALAAVVSGLVALPRLAALEFPSHGSTARSVPSAPAAEGVRAALDEADDVQVALPGEGNGAV